MKKKVAFICVHNSCRSQMAEAIGNHLYGDYLECYSAGTELKDQINQDAVRIVKELYGIDMNAKGHHSKLIDEIPVMRDDEHRSVVMKESLFQSFLGGNIQMVSRLVKY